MDEQWLKAIKSRLSAASPFDAWNHRVSDDGELEICIDDSDNSVVIWCGDMETCTGRDMHNHDLLGNAASDIARLVAEVERLRSDVERLQVALAQYANNDNWRMLPEKYEVCFVGPEVAQEALGTTDIQEEF